jgi:SWIM zinc finger
MLAKILAAADPVVTCQRERVRFESFSACAGVYARFDLHENGVKADRFGSGTTNVDFNPEMRALLARVTPSENLNLSVGVDHVRVTGDEAEAIERKVPLPLRWLRSFGEVQAILARMKPALRVSGIEARKFLRTLSKQSPRGAVWIVRSGNGLRVSNATAKEAVKVGGLGRMSALIDAANEATELIGWTEPRGSSAWELVFPEGRFVLVLSPETWRGFSGEGGLLEDLAQASDSQKITELRAKLKWQSSLDASSLAEELGRKKADVETSLALLAALGLVGFELETSTYFHRELPFRLDEVTALHPRLVDARKLIEQHHVHDLVTIDERTSAHVDAGNAGSYDVSIHADDFRCSCPWFGKHGKDRGPCKHVLAVQIVTGEAEEGS